MGVSLEAQFDENDEQIFFQLFDMAVGYTGMYTMLGDVTGRITGAIREGFESESAPAIVGEGPQWKELAWFTIQEREHEGFPGRHPINERTGEMVEALTRQPHIGQEGPFEFSAQMPERMSSFVEKKVMTAQYGDVFSKTPARPVLPMMNEAEEMVLVQMAEASLQETLNALYGLPGASE